MIVTTCGAAGAFGAFGAGAGDGAGVCAVAIVCQSNALINNTAEIMRLKFIVVMLTNHASVRTDSRLARFVVNQN